MTTRWPSITRSAAGGSRRSTRRGWACRSCRSRSWPRCWRRPPRCSFPARSSSASATCRRNRWIPYEDEPVALETAGGPRPRTTRARSASTIKNRGLRGRTQAPATTPTVEGVVVFADLSARTGGAASEFRLEEPESCRFTAEELYGDQWLFHGPALQAVVRDRAVVAARDRGDAPRPAAPGPVAATRLWPTLQTDPIVLDAFTHLLGCWGLDKQAGEQGDVIFPLRLAELDDLRRRPGRGDGDRLPDRESARSQRHRVRVDADTRRARRPGLDADLTGWEDWRFYWPGRYRDVFRQPDTRPASASRSL